MSTQKEDLEMIDELAARWLVERAEGFSSARQREFKVWCDLDPRHAVAVARLESACDLLAKMPLVRAELQPVIEFPLKPRLAKTVHGSQFTLARWSILAAASFAVLLIVAWTLSNVGDKGTEYATVAGGYERVVLADSSTVELNASSRIRVRFQPGARNVALISGQAHFFVAKDSSRPFTVAANGVEVQAVGTAFSVRLDETAVEVLVTEGRVKVHPETVNGSKQGNAAAAWTSVSAGERITLHTGQPGAAAESGPPSPVIERITKDEIRRAMAWQERRLVFRETPLREVVAEFNRRNRVQLVIADKALGERPVEGTFAADNVDAFVRLMEETGTLSATRHGDLEVYLTSR